MTDLPITITTETLAQLLTERALEGIATLERAVHAVDPVTIRAVLDQTLAVEANGGMLIRAKTRRRTPGGVFLLLLKHYLYDTGQHDALARVFPPRRLKSQRGEKLPAQPPARGAPPAPVRPRLRGLPAPLPQRHKQQRPSRPNQAQIALIIDTHLPPETGLYRRSIDADTGAVTLAFPFPAVAARRYADAIATIRRQARVPVTIAPQVHQGQLADAARDILGERAANAKVAIHLAYQSVTVTLPEGLRLAELLVVIPHFYERTGWTLAVVGPLHADRDEAG